jgi:hypothetical protein
MELRVKVCDTPLNIFGSPHGYSIQTSVSQPGLIKTPLAVLREIVEQINTNSEIPPKIPNSPQNIAEICVRQLAIGK